MSKLLAPPPEMPSGWHTRNPNLTWRRDDGFGYVVNSGRGCWLGYVSPCPPSSQGTYHVATTNSPERAALAVDHEIGHTP